MHSLSILFTQFPLLFYLCIAILGLCMGSFLNVVIYRTPLILKRQWSDECKQYLNPDYQPEQRPSFNLSLPASHCPQCHHQLRWYHNIPLLSWLILKGRCANCQQPIGIRYPFIELLTMFCSLTVAYVLGANLAMLAGLGLTWTLIALTFIDFDHQLLPDTYTIPLAVTGLLLNSWNFYTTAQQAIWGYLIGFLSLWLVYYGFKYCTGKEGMGYGDFKLLAALGAWMGPIMLPLIILLSSSLGAIIGVILLKIHKESRPFAFGPYIAIAGWIAFLWGEKIMDYYLNYAMP